MCSQSEGVRHLDRKRVQARCVVATTVLPHSCKEGPASPGKAPGVGRGYNVSCACSVRGCTVPVASVSCRSRLRTYHGIILFLESMKASRAGVMGRMVGGPAGSGALAWPQRKCLGAHPTPAGSWSRDWWGDRFMFPGRSFFFFFFLSPTQHCIALRVAREVR